MSKIGYIVNFNNNQFSTIPYLQVYSVDNYGPPKSLNIFALARRNARKVSSGFYQARTIYISLYINAPSRALADQALDQLWAILGGNEGSLVIEQSGYVRQYTCTFTKPEKNNTGVGKGNAAPPKGGFVDLTLEFECSDSYGYDTNYTKIVNQTSVTAALVNTEWTQGGSADTQVPMLQVQIQSLTNGTNPSITLGNQNTGQAVTIAQSFNPFDLIQVNSQVPSVQVNGVDVPFTGGIPEFGLGLQSFYYMDTFTARNINLFAYVYNRYQ